MCIATTMSRKAPRSWALVPFLVLLLALALALAHPVLAHADSEQLGDGAYEVPVTLSGGSGRASVASPARVTVADGQMTATIVWSSSSYDKMTVAGKDYAPTTTEGGSTFEIPVTRAEMKVKAETTAMSEPYTIDYTLSFDLESAQAAGSSGTQGGFPLAAVVGALAALLAIGIVLGVIASRRKTRR